MICNLMILGSVTLVMILNSDSRDNLQKMILKKYFLVGSIAFSTWQDYIIWALYFLWFDRISRFIICLDDIYIFIKGLAQ